MSIRKTLIIAGVIFLLVSFMRAPAFAAGHQITGTYTDMKFDQQGGDLLGVELRIVMTRNGYEGVLQFAEGGPGDLILVNVQLDGKRIKFVIPDDNSNAGSFSGVIGNGVLTGHFQYKGGGTEDVVLKRGKSYWD